MKAAKEKAEYWLNDNVSGWSDIQLKTLILLLKEQDIDTRHACAEAVNGLIWSCGVDNECIIDRDEAYSACMNVKAV